MLTQQEFDQLCTSIDCMDALNILGRGPMVSAHNVKALLQRWTERQADPCADGHLWEADGGDQCVRCGAVSG